MKTLKTDIVIVGGGMVGAALAVALSNSGHAITLVDANPFSSFDPRLLALNYASCCLLKNLNLYAALESNMTPIHAVHVSERGRFGSVSIFAKELAVPLLGAVVRASQLNQVLAEALSKTSVEIIRPAKVVGLKALESGYAVTLEAHENEMLHLETGYVVGADGTHSTIRQLLAMETCQQDYEQSALVVVSELTQSSGHTAYERFLLKEGAIAMLPLSHQQCATIWTASHAFIQSLMAMNDADFIQQIQAAFGYRLGIIKKVGQRFTFPLVDVRVKEPVLAQAVLIGNAAHTIHPLGAQGLNIALYEVALLADIFNVSSLRGLQLSKKVDFSTRNGWNMRLSGVLNTLFSTDCFPVSRLRQLGMIGINICGMIKQPFAAIPLGHGGKVPSLLCRAD